MLVFAVAACSQATGDVPTSELSTASEPQASQENVESAEMQEVPSIDPSAYIGARPTLVVNDPAFRAAIDGVPGELKNCIVSTIQGLSASMEQIPGGVASQAWGSHAEGFTQASLVLAEGGLIEIGSTCASSSESNREGVAVFTSDVSGKPRSPTTLEWLDFVGQNSQVVDLISPTATTQVAPASLMGSRNTVSQQAGGAVDVGTYSLAQGDEVRTIGGMLAVVSDEEFAIGPKELRLGGVAVPGVDGDFINLIGLVKYVGRDVVVVTTGCNGSACGWTSIGLVEVGQGGARAFGFDSMTAGEDGAVPKIEALPDGSFMISFRGMDGVPETFKYRGGGVAKI